MKNKHVLILGASSDIGWATAEQFAKVGYKPILAGRNVAALKDRLDKSSLDKDTLLIKFDARSFDDHKKWVSDLSVSPDVTVCVFGYLGEQKKAEEEWSEAKEIIDSNYAGAVSILNEVALLYRKQKQGTIVGVSSVGGDRGRQSNYIYGSAKAGFTTYLAGLRNKLFQEGVHVVTIKPGFVQTKMTAGLNLPPALTATADQVAVRIVKATIKKSNVAYTLPIWYWIMLIIRNIPEFIFKRLKL